MYVSVCLKRKPSVGLMPPQPMPLAAGPDSEGQTATDQPLAVQCIFFSSESNFHIAVVSKYLFYVVVVVVV